MSLKARFSRFSWPQEDVGEFEGARYFFAPALERRLPPEGAAFVWKPRSFIERYVEVLDGAPTAKVLELGVFAGGSLLALADLFDAEKLVGVEIGAPVPLVEDTLRSHPRGGRVKVFFDTAQDDEAKLCGIVQAEFPGGLDLVIDDASHFYAQSRRSFEILFPHVRPGGWYVFEDWGWAHLPEDHWPGEPSPAGFVFELQLAWLGRPDLIGRIVVEREMVFVQKAPAAPLGGRLVLSELYSLHGRSPPVVA